MSIEAMKQALEALDCIYSPLHVREINKVSAAMDVLRQAIEQAEKQEPVAWMFTSHFRGDERYITRYQSELSTYKADKVWPLYAAPPRKEWVGLTKKEIDEESKYSVQVHGFISGANWANEELLKKNQ